MQKQKNQTQFAAAYLSSMPESGFMRLWQIIGDRKKGVAPILPIGRTSFLNGVKDGTYPRPVKLGARSVAWKVSEIRELLERLEGGAVL